MWLHKHFQEDCRYDYDCFRRLKYTPSATSYPNIMGPRPIYQKGPAFLGNGYLFSQFIPIVDQKRAQYQYLVNIWSLLFQKDTQRRFFILSPSIFLALNSRDITMLWVLNLFSKSSPTILWKGVFEKTFWIFFNTWSGIVSLKL